MIGPYLDYILNRKNAHGIHSPFVFDFYNNVLQGKRTCALGNRYRFECLNSQTLINRTDYGAGSKSLKKAEKVCDIAKKAGTTKKKGQLLSLICSYYGYENILELGTSLGIGSAYILDNLSVTKLISYEGCKETSDFANAKLNHFFGDRAEVRNNRFDEIKSSDFDAPFDLIFIDGNHTYEGTLTNYENLKSCLSPNGMIIFDDIYWSKEMSDVWREIVGKDEVKVSIDIFSLGLISFRQEQEKEHFILKF